MPISAPGNKITIIIIVKKKFYPFNPVNCQVFPEFKRVNLETKRKRERNYIFGDKTTPHFKFILF